jgi:pectate lyase
MEKRMKIYGKFLNLSRIGVLLCVLYLSGCGGPAGPGDEPVDSPVSGPTDEPVDKPDGNENQEQNLSITITAAGGWLETAYVTWEPFTGAEKYHVYYTGGGVSDWTRIDDPLIRGYGTYWRADIPGLAAGVYRVKVAALAGGGETGAAEWDDIRVERHDRSGFAFAGGVVPGAYTADGTLKPGTRVLYVTDSSKDTVTLPVKTAASKEETFTGLKAILLDAMQKGYETRPLAVRFIGKITENGFTLEGGDIVVKDNGRNNGKTSYVTLEGIGGDAVAYGWGIRTSKASNVEIRNLAFMLTNSNGKDCFEAQDSEYLWIHNNDFFYGNAGGDADQNKGDGAMDTKKNTWMTYSYNHFWDTGKSSLLGNGSEPPGYHTYHHNWFDHSDSRHPRVRNHYVHVYNNFYDGVSKYGIGAAAYSPSIFVEANYFLNTRSPMLISMQGSDTAGGGGGTFSSEDGGMIKAYNNYMDTYSAGYFKPWSPSNTVEFDAYVASSRNEQVPDTVKAKRGGAAYNNFDTGSQAAVVDACLVDPPEAARVKVKQYAGRYYGGDFTWTFTVADTTHYDVNNGLKTALQNYTSGIVSVQGGENGASPGEGSGGGEGDGGVTGEAVCHFTGSAPSNSAFTVNGNYSSGKGSVTVDGGTYNICVKMESSTKISFTITEPMTLTLYFGTANDNAAGKKVKIDGTGETVSGDGTLVKSLSAGSHEITKGDTMHLFYIRLSAGGGT